MEESSDIYVPPPPPLFSFWKKFESKEKECKYFSTSDFFPPPRVVASIAAIYREKSTRK